MPLTDSRTGLRVERPNRYATGPSCSIVRSAEIYVCGEPVGELPFACTRSHRPQTASLAFRTIGTSHRKTPSTSCAATANRSEATRYLRAVTAESFPSSPATPPPSRRFFLMHHHS